MRSISAPANKNHCAFHPSAIAIAISAGAFHSARFFYCQSRHCGQRLRVLHASVATVHCVPDWLTISCAISACGFLFLHQRAKMTVHSIHQPSPSQSVLVHSSLCIPPTGNPRLQSVRVCPTSASATTVHCVFDLAQSELVFSISTPVNQNHLCSPHNRQPHRNQCLWIPWCAFHHVLPFCSFCLLAITPKQSVPVCPTFSSVTTDHWVLHLPAISVAISACAFFFCTCERKSLCILPISRHHRNQCLCIPFCAFHPPAITVAISACVTNIRVRNHSSLCVSPAGHLLCNPILFISALVNETACTFRPWAILIAISACAFQSVHFAHWQSHNCNQSVCVQHPGQTPKPTLCSTCRPLPLQSGLCFLSLH